LGVYEVFGFSFFSEEINRKNEEIRKLHKEMKKMKEKLKEKDEDIKRIKEGQSGKWCGRKREDSDNKGLGRKREDSDDEGNGRKKEDSDDESRRKEASPDPLLHSLLFPTHTTASHQILMQDYSLKDNKDSLFFLFFYLYAYLIMKINYEKNGL
jgi:hypothetical protein